MRAFHAGVHYMFQFSAEQMKRLGDDVFRGRLISSLAGNDKDFAAMSPEAQKSFVIASHEQASRLGFRTEQGVAAYALGGLWLGVGFETSSPLLQRLLQTPIPEARKVHAMGDWVHDQLGPGSTPRSGDAALRRSLGQTVNWGINGP